MWIKIEKVKRELSIHEVTKTRDHFNVVAFQNVAGNMLSAISRQLWENLFRICLILVYVPKLFSFAFRGGKKPVLSNIYTTFIVSFRRFNFFVVSRSGLCTNLAYLFAYCLAMKIFFAFLELLS